MTDPAAPGANPAAGPPPGPNPYPAPAQPSAPDQPGAVPAPPYGAPPPPTAPPPKKGNALKIVLIVLAAVVVLCAVGIFAVVRWVGSAFDFSVGKCVDVLPISEVAVEVSPKAVACDSAEAESKIVAVHEGSTLAEADTLCADAPGYIGALQIGAGSDARLLCLASL